MPTNDEFIQLLYFHAADKEGYYDDIAAYAGMTKGGDLKLNVRLTGYYYASNDISAFDKYPNEPCFRVHNAEKSAHYWVSDYQQDGNPTFYLVSSTDASVNAYIDENSRAFPCRCVRSKEPEIRDYFMKRENINKVPKILTRSFSDPAEYPYLRPNRYTKSVTLYSGHLLESEKDINKDLLFDRFFSIFNDPDGRIPSEIHINAHTCSSGTNRMSYCKSLVDTVSSLITTQMSEYMGAEAATRVSEKCFGSEYPIYTNSTPTGRGANERLEINLVYDDW